MIKLMVVQIFLLLLSFWVNLPLLFLYLQGRGNTSERGHVAEWFNAPYLKYDVPRYHEFESHLVRFILQSSYPVPLTKETIFP